MTVEAISDRAEVAPRTFFNYFPSKEDAVLDRDPDRPEALRRALLDRPAGEDALTALRRVLDDDVADRVLDADAPCAGCGSSAESRSCVAAMAAMLDDIEQALVAGVAERTGQDPDADLCPALLVSAACGAFKVAHLRWSDQGGRVPFDRLLAAAFDTLARGLARTAGADRRRSTAEAPPAPGPRAYSHRQIMLIMSGLMMGLLLAALDQTIVSTALTTISRDFHRLDLYGWVVTAYLLTSTASTPLYGKISDQFGRKRIFQFAIVDLPHRQRPVRAAARACTS